MLSGGHVVVQPTETRHPPLNPDKQGLEPHNDTNRGAFATRPSGARVYMDQSPPNTITAVPNPISIGPDGPIFAANETLPNDYASGVLSLSYGMGNCSMSPGFDGYNAKSCSCVNRIGKWYHDYATATVTTTQCQSSYDWHYITEVQSLGCSEQVVTQLQMPYTAPTDCCDKCGIAGKAVRLLYWPPQTADVASGKPVNAANVAAPPQPAASYGYVSDGFTFISPSVYVIYTSISASASCVARVASYISIGSVHQYVTRAYAPEALSTARCMAENAGAGLRVCVYPEGGEPDAQHCFEGVANGWDPINYSELANPPPDSEIFRRKSTCIVPNPDFTMDAGFARSMFLNPQLSFPSDVSEIDSVWATWGHNTCTAVNLGVADPPRALGQASALGPAPGQQSPQDIHAHQPGFLTQKPDMAPPTKQVPHGVYTPGPSPGDQLQNPAPSPTPAPRAGNPSQKPPHTNPKDDPSQSGYSGHDPPLHQSLPHEGHPENAGPPSQQSSPHNNDPVVHTFPEAKPVPVGSGHNPRPAPAPIPLTPEKPFDPKQQAPQKDSVVGQAVNKPFNRRPSHKQAAPQPPAGPKPPSPTDPVPLVQAVPSIQVGGHPVFQHPDKNIVIGSNTIPPGSHTQNDDHAISNGVDTVVVDGKTQHIAPTPALAQPATLPSINNHPIHKHLNGDIVVADSTIPVGGSAIVQGHAIENHGPNFVLDGSSVGSTQPTQPAPPNLPVMDNNPIQKQQNGNLVAGSVTVPPGVQTTVAGHAISNGPTQVILDGQTFAAAPLPSAIKPLFTNNQIVHITNGGLEVASQTLIPGSLVTLSGHVVDYANPSRVIVDGKTHELASVSSAQPFIIGGQTLSRGSNGAIIIAGSTVTATGDAVVAGHTFSVAGSGHVIEDGQTYSLPQITNAYVVQALTTHETHDPLQTQPITLSNGLVITPEAGVAPGADPTFHLPNGHDISAGGTPVTISGTAYSLLPSGKGLLVNGHSTLALPMVTAGEGAGSSPTPAMFSVDGTTFTADPTGFVIGSTSVKPGGKAVTIDGVIVSLDKQSHVRVGKSTIDLESQNPVATNGIITVGGKSITAAPTGFVVDGQTVAPGGKAVTVDGTIVSLDKSDHLQVGTSSILLTGTAGPADTATTSSAGGVLPAGSAGVGNSSATAPQAFQSGSEKTKSMRSSPLALAFVIGMIIWM